MRKKNSHKLALLTFSEEQVIILGYIAIAKRYEMPSPSMKLNRSSTHTQEVYRVYEIFKHFPTVCG